MSLRAKLVLTLEWITFVSVFLFALLSAMGFALVFRQGRIELPYIYLLGGLLLTSGLSICLHRTLDAAEPNQP